MEDMKIVGVDEAGRGPLAGPVAVGLVCAAHDFSFRRSFPKLNDSKQLSEAVRERLFERLEKYVALGKVKYAVLMRSAQEIDERGIAVVIREAIEEGLGSLLIPGEGKVWLDGALSAPAVYEQETVIGGDGKIPAIMLASIAAKVVRDRHMRTLHEVHSLYGFDAHKGYGTKAHFEAIRTHGICDIHRKTFVHV